MALEIGSRLGHYDVTALIGEGGMGQVYQATDTKLKRQVALKILPEAFSADPERLARFQREAEVLASLNHPNIAAIYGIEQSGDARALVLELVEGPTLADRIKQGPIPLDEALPIAKQIAEALEAAHEKGIIHRDLKPANVVVKDDGTVKVLDFGLAKALDPSPTGDPSQSPTLTAMATQMGVIMGTAAYMSPEQARGKTVDKRADIWSFGVVLLEMLTGRKVFEGEDVSLTLSAVLQREPDWTLLSADVAPTLQVYLRRCVQKDPKQRVQAIGDMRLAMEGVFETTSHHTATPERASPGALRLALPWGIAAVSVLGLIVTLSQSLGEDTTPLNGSVRFTIEMPERASFRIHSGSLAISPDGSRVAFPVGRGPTAQLYLRPLGSLESEPVRGTEGGVTPFFSPDGASLGFFADGQLKRVSVDGGTPLPIAEARHWWGASWGVLDTIVYTPSIFSPIWQVAADRGEPRQLTTLEEGELGHWWPHFLPEERAVLFTSYNALGPTVEVYAMDTGQRHTILNGGFARYVPTGHLLFVQNGALMAAPFDLERLETRGAAVPVVEDVAYSFEESGSQYATSDSGALVYLTAAAMNPPLALTAVDRGGSAELLFEPDRFVNPKVSPDGRHVAVSIKDADYTPDLWVLDLDRGSRTRITDDWGDKPNAVWTWSGDDLLVAYEGAEGVPYFRAGRTPADGSGQIEPLLESEDGDVIPSSLTPDGQVLAYVAVTHTSMDIWTMPADGGGPLERSEA